MTFNEVLAHFEVKKRDGDRARCICPCHADLEASLSISKGFKGVVLHCFAGCETADILDAVGLKMGDLFDGEFIQTGEKWQAFIESRENRKIEGVYHYVDLNGNYAFTRIRLSGKEFRYGILEDGRFNYGLRGKKRKEIPSVYCESLQAINKAIDSGERIFYCEGEKDVNTMISHGLKGITCGASGDWNEGCATLFQGADVVILADNDESGRESARVIKKDLQIVAKSVRILTPTPEVDHGDISDYFKNHSVGDLEELLNQPEEINLDQFHLINENGRVTGVYDFEIRQYLKETQDIRIVGKVPYIYEKGVFRPDHSGAKLKTMIEKLIYPQFVKSTTIKRIYDLFLSDTELQVSMDGMNQYPVEWINFKNAFYNPVAKELIPHDPKYLAINQCPHVFDPDRGVKGTLVGKWLSFSVPDLEDLEMLLQFFGLCLNRDTKQQKFLVLFGVGGTGKSILIRLINLSVGWENVSNISLHQLTQRFSAIQLMGKLVNSCADLEIEALSDTSILKKALGEDSFSAEYKGKDPISIRNYAKLIFSTNQLPVIKGEVTNGFYRRLLILPMNNIPEKRDPYFFDQLSTEIDDLIWLSVKALERMYKNGNIAESKNSIEAVKRLRCDSDTVEAFLTNKTRKSPNGKTKKLDLFREYQNYCLDMERQALTKQNFYRTMKTKGVSEIKSGGTECFRGVEILPNESPKISLNEWQNTTSERVPFD